MDRLCEDTCSHVCPQTWFYNNEAKTSVGLSQTYFAILGELSLGLSLTVGFLKTFGFL